MEREGVKLSILINEELPLAIVGGRGRGRAGEFVGFRGFRADRGQYNPFNPLKEIYAFLCFLKSIKEKKMRTKCANFLVFDNLLFIWYYLLFIIDYLLYLF